MGLALTVQPACPICRNLPRSPPNPRSPGLSSPAILFLKSSSWNLQVVFLPDAAVLLKRDTRRVLRTVLNAVKFFRLMVRRLRLRVSSAQINILAWVFCMRWCNLT